MRAGRIPRHRAIRVTLAQPPSSTEGPFLLSVTSRGIRLVPQKPSPETALLVADFCGFPGSVLLVQKVLLVARGYQR